jgi:hypothetical protein
MADNIVRRTSLWVAAAFTTAFLGTTALAGCSSATGDCTSLCVESFTKCNTNQGAPQTTDAQAHAECQKICTQEAKIADMAGCSSDFDDAIACVDSLPNICDARVECSGGTGMPLSCTGPCGQENQAVNNCITKFCSDPKNKQVCNIQF